MTRQGSSRCSRRGRDGSCPRPSRSRRQRPTSFPSSSTRPRERRCPRQAFRSPSSRSARCCSAPRAGRRADRSEACRPGRPRRARQAHARVAAELGEGAAPVGGGHRSDEGADALQAGVRRRVRLLEDGALRVQAYARIEADENARAGLMRALRRGCGRDEKYCRRQRQQDRRRTNRSRPHGSSLGVGTGRYKAPTGGLSVRPHACVVVPERRQQEGEDPHAEDAEDSARDDRGAHAEECGDDAGFEVPEERAARVAHLLDAREAAAQPVRDRLVPERRRGRFR